MTQRASGVSAATDDLAATLVGLALDRLADGDDVNVLLAVGDARGTIASYEFSDDGTEALLEGALAQIGKLVKSDGDPNAGLGSPIRYALVYEGAVDAWEDGAGPGGAGPSGAGPGGAGPSGAGPGGAGPGGAGTSDAARDSTGRGRFADALLLEFGEVGYRAYSAYCLYEGRGAGDAFRWTEPAPAGEVEPLL